MAEDSSEVVREQSESVAAANLKTLGDGPAFYANLAYAQALDAAAGWRQLNQAVVSKGAESIFATSPSEGAVDTAIAQILNKTAGNMPPVTP